MNAKVLLLAVIGGLPGCLVSLVIADGVLAVNVADRNTSVFGNYRFDEGDEARPAPDVAAEIVAMHARIVAERVADGSAGPRPTCSIRDAAIS